MSDLPNDSQTAEVKPEGGSEQINIKVVNQENQEVFFKIKKSTKLSKLMDSYCQRQGLRKENVRFKLDGVKVNGEDTPLSLDLEDGTIIDVFLEQVGGSF